MKTYRADLHIHTVLSPCGSLEMSPQNIIREAFKKNLEIIGITDHNSTLHAALVRKMAEKYGITVLMGAEVTTREEVHCLTFFEDEKSLNEFQEYIDQWLPFIRNNPQTFGYQVVIDEDEQIIREIDGLLITGIDQSIGEVRRKVKELNGIFIPAHVNRPVYGLFGQLGFMPEDLCPDAIEIWNQYPASSLLAAYPGIDRYALLVHSDAHTPAAIGSGFCEYKLQAPVFPEIRKALARIENREVTIP